MKITHFIYIILNHVTLMLILKRYLVKHTKQYTEETETASHTGNPRQLALGQLLGNGHFRKIKLNTTYKTMVYLLRTWSYTWGKLFK